MIFNPASSSYFPTMILSQTVGVPVGAGANVKVFEIDATFSEILPDYGFVG